MMNMKLYIFILLFGAALHSTAAQASEAETKQAEIVSCVHAPPELYMPLSLFVYEAVELMPVVVETRDEPIHFAGNPIADEVQPVVGLHGRDIDMCQGIATAPGGTETNERLCASHSLGVPIIGDSIGKEPLHGRHVDGYGWG